MKKNPAPNFEEKVCFLGEIRVLFFFRLWKLMKPDHVPLHPL